VATNFKFTEDDSFAIVVEPDDLRAGQKLWVPGAQRAKSLVAEAQTGELTGVFYAPPAGELVVRDKAGRSRRPSPGAMPSGPSWHVLRFYPDGLVLGATIQVEDVASSWPRIARWFHRDKAEPRHATGKYLRCGDCLGFFLDLGSGRAYTTGFYYQEQLHLSSKGDRSRTYRCLDVAFRTEKG
jgi:hypothetical protein